MRKSLFLLCLFLGSASCFAQQKAFPIIKNFGGVYYITEATVRADKDLNYKMVIDVVTPGPTSLDLCEGLNNIARLMNLHGVNGVQKEQLDIVAAIHGDATYAVLKDPAYQRLFGRPNPNVDLIRELTIAGVQLTVCGQSLIARGVAPKDVLREVQVATSMLTTVSVCQAKGYGQFRF